MCLGFRSTSHRSWVGFLKLQEFSLNQPPADPDALSEFQFGQAHTANVGIQASQLVFSGSYFVGLRAAQLYVDVQDRAAERDSR